ncbi:nuclear transport factor 2 family protein [Streptomyces sp. NPDC007205]|uniref:nuclear transport factor 2 family protein n=1 Tax=Streptomyces sp. NPDC007205 TaxID=3154316 RepID=UPI0033F5AD10
MPSQPCRNLTEDLVLIQELAHQCSFYADHGPAQPWLDLFTDDGEWSIPASGIYVRGKENLRLLIDTIHTMVRNVHHMQSNFITAIDGDRATASCEVNSFINTEDGPQPLDQGLYHYTFQRIHGQWYIVSRAKESPANLKTVLNGPHTALLVPYFDRLVDLFGQTTRPQLPRAKKPCL